MKIPARFKTTDVLLSKKAVTLINSALPTGCGCGFPFPPASNGSFFIEKAAGRGGDLEPKVEQENFPDESAKSL